MIEAILEHFGYVHVSRLPFGPNSWLDADESQLTESGKLVREQLHWQRVHMICDEMRRLKIGELKVSA